MIVADVVRGIAIATMGTLVLTGAVRLWHLVVLAAVYGAGEALFGPANSAIVPDLVPSDLLVQANSLGQFVRPFAMTLLGPAIGGVLVGTVGPGWAFVVDASTFAFSGLMITLMRAQPVQRDRQETTAWRDLVEGLHYVRSRTWLWAAMAAATVSLLCFWGPFEVLVPFLVKNSLHGTATELGFVFAAGGMGSVVAAAVMGQRNLPHRPLTVMYLAWGLGTLLIAGFGLARSLWPMYVVAAASAACFTVLLVNWFTLLQRLVPSSLLGRVSSLDWWISSAGIPVSFALTGPVAAWLGVRATLIWAGVLGTAVIALCVVAMPGVRAPERDGSLAEPTS
jgi:predicted MFS family arabinose efflux permease